MTGGSEKKLVKWGFYVSKSGNVMYSRNLFVLDFVRRFFVSCAQISEAYTVWTLMKFGCNWQKIGHKSKCRKDSESTLYRMRGITEGEKAKRKF